MENEEYNPEEPFYYKYKGVDFLTSDLEIEPIRYRHIYISCYDVNLEGKYPFLRFLLSKPYLNADLSFPQLYLLQNVIIGVYPFISVSLVKKKLFQLHSLLNDSN
jgi:hypothetical protein